jgi:hypothetical protein
MSRHPATAHDLGLSSRDEGQQLGIRDVDRAARSYALAHVCAMLAGVVSAILLHRGLAGSGPAMPGILCLVVATGIIVVARVEYRRVLVEEARRRGLDPAAARAHARRVLARHAARRPPSPW